MIKEPIGPELMALIKKKPHTQLIGGVQFTYSMVRKKKFFGSDDLFLVLKGLDYVSYAKFNSKMQLPFTEESQLPKTEALFQLAQLE